MQADDTVAQRGTNLGRRAWLVPLLLFVAYAVYLLAAQRVLLFGHFMLPLGDNAVDDLLIFDAKRLRLLHGNYSRFGFYHPGPWFLYVAAFGEWVFYDEAGLFRSYVGAQAFALSLTHGIAFAFCCRLWLLVTGRTSLALMATVVIAAVIAAPLSPANPFVQLWTPYSTIAASLLSATGLAGCVLRGPSWLPLLVLGSAQMVHGHASFLGIVPMILVLALLLAAGLRRLPFRPSCRPAALAWLARNRTHLGFSLAIAVLYALPLILHTVLHWPGELRKYWDFLGALPPQPVAAAWRYGIAFVPLGGLWILLFLLPSGEHRQADDLRAAGIVVFFAACIPAFWYSWREVDNVANRYLLLWVTPFVGTALVAGLLYVLRTTVLNQGWRVLPCLLAACLAVNSLRRMEPWLAIDQARNLALQRAIDRMLSRPPSPDGGRIELFVDPMPTAWVSAWIETATALAVFRRAGRREFCVSPETWNIVFGEHARCDLGHDRIADRLVVTTWAKISPGAFRFDQSGMIHPTGLRPGTTRSMPETITQGLALESGWSVFQPDGIWTDAAEAKLGFPATALPDHFRITLGGALMAPRDRPQIVHVFDAADLELGTLHGGTGPASVMLNVSRKPGTERVTLTLRVEHPTTPAELGMGRDRRRLGFRLSELSVLP